MPEKVIKNILAMEIRIYVELLCENKQEDEIDKKIKKWDLDRLKTLYEFGITCGFYSVESYRKFLNYINT